MSLTPLYSPTNYRSWQLIYVLYLVHEQFSVFHSGNGQKKVVLLPFLFLLWSTFVIYGSELNEKCLLRKKMKKIKTKQTGKCPTNKQTPNLNKSNSYSGSPFLDLFLLLNSSILLPELMHPSFCKWIQTFNSRGWKLQIAVPASENRTDAVSSHSQAGLLSPAAPFPAVPTTWAKRGCEPLGSSCTYWETNG